MKYLISVIIPVYNTNVKLLDDCFRSINNQTYDNFECIIVNDKSTNFDTNIFLENYAKKNSKFSLINLPENLGPGYARNEGIKKSKGDIIVFVDSDDYILNICLEQVHNCFIKHQGLEIFSYENFIRRKDGSLTRSANYTFDTGVVNVDTFNNIVLDKCSVWAKAYSKKFIIENELFFPKENYFMEDLYYLITTYSKSKKIVFSKEQLYVLNENDNSRSRSPMTIEKAYGLFQNVKLAYEKIKNDNSYISKNYKKLFNLWFYANMYEMNTSVIFFRNPEYAKLLQLAKEFQESIK